MKTNIRFLLTAGLVLATTLTISCGPSAAYHSASGEPVYYDKLTYEGETYKTVKMPDGKVWMAENLRYVSKNSKVKLHNHSASRFGRYYNWEEAMKACPAGWHLPTKEEWNAMVAAIGGVEVEGKYLKVSSNADEYQNLLPVSWGWQGYNIRGSRRYPGYGEDKYGFGAYPAGCYTPDDFRTSDGKLVPNDEPHDSNLGAYFWLASEASTGNAYVRALANFNYEHQKDINKLIMNDKEFEELYKWLQQGEVESDEEFRVALSNSNLMIRSKAILHSVRCVKGEGSEAVVTALVAPVNDSRDGKTYEAVKIGEQTWMAENLNYETSDSKCYDNKTANCDKYGRLYTWENAMTACPSGWHLPSDGEWQTLVDFTGGKEVAGPKLRSKSGWSTHKGYIAGKDYYNFSALPGGMFFNGSSVLIDLAGYWWSATENDANDAYCLTMGFGSNIVGDGNINKASLFSVRCIKD